MSKSILPQVSWPTLLAGGTILLTSVSALTYYQVQSHSDKRHDGDMDTVPLVIMDVSVSESDRNNHPTRKQLLSASQSSSSQPCTFLITLSTPQLILHPATSEPYTIKPAHIKCELTVDMSRHRLTAWLQLRDVTMTRLRADETNRVTPKSFSSSSSHTYELYQAQPTELPFPFTATSSSSPISLQLVHILRAENKWSATDPGFYVYLTYTCTYVPSDPPYLSLDVNSECWDQDIDVPSQELVNTQAGSYQVTQTVMTFPDLRTNNTSSSSHPVSFRSIVRVLKMSNTTCSTIIARPITNDPHYKTSLFSLPFSIVGISQGQHVTLTYLVWSADSSIYWLFIQRKMFVDNRQCLNLTDSHVFGVNMISQTVRPIHMISPISSSPHHQQQQKHTARLYPYFLLENDPQFQLQFYTIPSLDAEVRLAYFLVLKRRTSTIFPKVNGQDRTYVYRELQYASQTLISESLSMKVDKQQFIFDVTIRDIFTAQPHVKVVKTVTV